MRYLDRIARAMCPLGWVIKVSVCRKRINSCGWVDGYKRTEEVLTVFAPSEYVAKNTVFHYSRALWPQLVACDIVSVEPLPGGEPCQ